MQGKLLIGVMTALLGSTGAMAAEQIKRQPCPKTEQQVQQRQQPAQQRERAKPQGCPVTRNIPPAVDPTPNFLL